MDFTTDVIGQQLLLLTPSLAMETLTIKSDDEEPEVIAIHPAPASGWTHELICALEVDLGEHCTADAYLGSQWIGLTEG